MSASRLLPALAIVPLLACLTACEPSSGGSPGQNDTARDVPPPHGDPAALPLPPDPGNPPPDPPANPPGGGGPPDTPAGPPPPVPEPGTMILVGAGLAGLAAYARRRRGAASGDPQG